MSLPDNRRLGYGCTLTTVLCRMAGSPGAGVWLTRNDQIDAAAPGDMVL